VLICCAVPAQTKEGDAPLVLELWVGWRHQRRGAHGIVHRSWTPI